MVKKHTHKKQMKNGIQSKKIYMKKNIDENQRNERLWKLEPRDKKKIKKKLNEK